MADDPTSDERSRAAAQIARRRAFWWQAATFLVVAVVLVVIWAVTGAGFFWPIFVILAFAVALAARARSVFGATITDADIDREIDRHRG